MKRILTVLAVASVLAMMVVAMAVPAFAVSPSQEQCEAQGGTFTREQGEARCVIVTVEEGKNPKFTEEETETTTGRGNIENKQEQTQTTECEGTGSGKCPPGQF